MKEKSYGANEYNEVVATALLKYSETIRISQVYNDNDRDIKLGNLLLVEILEQLRTLNTNLSPKPVETPTPVVTTSQVKPVGVFQKSKG
jgi:hypothetical protein